MNLKYFDAIDGAWYDVSGNTGSSLEYSDVSGWVTTGGYKKYVAEITQSGTDAPTQIILENNLGFTPNWEYNDAGVYGFNFEDYDFKSEKCIYFLNNTIDFNPIWVELNSNFQFTIKTHNQDNIITQTILEIRYYN